MDWYDITDEYHERTLDDDGSLSSLPEEWRRELAALWRLEADVNNGAYLQFLENWGRETYVYASQGLKKIGAKKMLAIVDKCQALVDENYPGGESADAYHNLLSNPVVGSDGEILEQPESVLPQHVIDETNRLSYEFMNYPDDLAKLGLRYYRSFLEGDTC